MVLDNKLCGIYMAGVAQVMTNTGCSFQQAVTTDRQKFIYDYCRIRGLSPQEAELLARTPYQRILDHKDHI